MTTDNIYISPLKSTYTPTFMTTDNIYISPLKSTYTPTFMTTDNIYISPLKSTYTPTFMTTDNIYISPLKSTYTPTFMTTDNIYISPLKSTYTPTFMSWIILKNSEYVFVFLITSWYWSNFIISNLSPFCIFNHLLILIELYRFKSIFMGDKILSILIFHSDGCWWPGNGRSEGISMYCTGLVCREC